MGVQSAYIATALMLFATINAVNSFPEPALPGEPPKVPRVNAEWEDPLGYLDESTALFGQRLKQYGVEKLPLPNKNFTVNETRYNIPLDGDLRYSNGFVLDILNISRYYRQYSWYFEGDDLAYIKYKILLGDASTLYDLHGNLKVNSNLIGTAELTFPENLIEVLLACNKTTKAVSLVSMTTNSVEGPKTNYAPDSDIMRAVAYNARLTMANSLFADLTLWIDSALRSLLESVIQDIPFPLTYTRNGRQKRPYIISSTQNKRRWRV